MKEASAKASQRAAVFTTLAIAVFAGPAAAQDGKAWQPDKNIEFIVGASPAGGNDRIARTVQKILQQHKLVPTSMTVVNKPGGGGEVGRAYLNQYPGNGHYISINPLTLLTNGITGRSKTHFTDFTPIAHLIGEYIVYAVKADSGIKTAKQLADRLAADAGSLSAAISGGPGSHNHIGIAMVITRAGGDPKKLRAVAFNASGESLTALLGGHVDLMPASASNVVEQMKAGSIRVLAVSAPKRMEGVFANVPTWRELGFDAVMSNWRSIEGPRGLTPEQIRYWENVFNKLQATPEWQEEMRANYWIRQSLSAEETKKFLAAEEKTLRAIMKDVGLVQ